MDSSGGSQRGVLGLLVGGLGCVDSLLWGDRLCGIARLVFLVAPAANHRDVFLADAVGFENFLGLLRRDFPKPDGRKHIVTEISGESVLRVVGAFVDISDFFRRASALRGKLAAENGGGIAYLASEL